MLRATNLQAVRRPFERFGLGFLAALVCGAIIATSHSKVYALPLQQRSLAVADVTPGANTTHTFKFTYTSSDPIAAVVFEYCTSPLLQIACLGPTGLDVSGASLTSQTGETGFAISSASANKITLSRASAASPVGVVSEYVFSPVVNPTGAPDTFYVRISTHALADASDPSVDFGAVVNSTTRGVVVSSEVPPILKFCVGLTIAAEDCETAEGNIVDLGELTTSRAAYGSSQMLAATNAEFGLAIAAYGTTMTSGNNVIPALASPTASAPGNAQFGLNLRKNTEPPFGEEPSGTGISLPAAAYDIPNRFTFNPGDIVATSPDATDTRKFTASYIVNIPPGQAAGVYTATLTYICTATF